MTPVDGAADAFCYVTSTGRRTGRAHTIEIWFAASPAAPVLYVLTSPRSDTVANLGRRPSCTVRIGAVEHRAEARALEPGSDEDVLARRLLLAKYQSPGSSDLEHWGTSAHAIAFDLDP